MSRVEQLDFALILFSIDQHFDIHQFRSAAVGPRTSILLQLHLVSDRCSHYEGGGGQKRLW